MNRETFGTYLKTARAARSLPLSEVARITKIPERSLELLERGAAEGLPADVFVKGFVGSYAKVVGLDAAEAMARYGEAVRGEPTVAPRSSGLAARLAPGLSAGADAEAHASRDESMGVGSGSRAAVKVERAPGGIAPAAARSPKRAASASGPGSDDEEGVGRYRVGLTFAVIVLVIIATLTLSFLLRRPSQDGDSVSPVSRVSQPASETTSGPV
ncbi:MAG: helix-turn-helix domain-containing protein [Deltaproteobacteria bacterium]|nr:helix-turn-helix domain-containing protein [Deltaproteobacteria bacterium]